MAREALRIAGEALALARKPPMTDRHGLRPARKYALAGRVLTMDERGTVLERGVV
jgi:hypothetical protein